MSETRSKPGRIHLRIVEVLKRFRDGVTGGQIRGELEKRVCGLKIRRTWNVVAHSLRFPLPSLSTRIGCRFKVLQEKFNLLLCKGLAVGVKLRQ